MQPPSQKIGRAMTGTFDPLPPLVAENFKHEVHSEPDAYDGFL
jgi:hypothetical protein